MLVHNGNLNDKLLYFKNSSSELGRIQKNSKDFIIKVVWVRCIVYYLQLLTLNNVLDSEWSHDV